MCTIYMQTVGWKQELTTPMETRPNYKSERLFKSSNSENLCQNSKYQNSLRGLYCFECGYGIPFV